MSVGTVFIRWGVKKPDKDFGKKEIGEIWAISLGLGALFNEDVMAERVWMMTENSELGAIPLNFVLAGQSEAVLEQVNKERGL